MYIIKVNRQSVTKVTSAWHSNTDLASQPTLTILGQTCSGRAWQELSGICLCGLNKKKHPNRYICCIHVMVCYKPFIKYLDSALKKELRKTERSHVGCYGTWITKRLFWAGAMCAEKPCPCCILSGYVLKCAALSHWCPSAPHAALSHDLKPSFHLCYELKCMFVYIPLFEFFLKSLQRLPSFDGGVIFSADCPAYPQCLVFCFFFSLISSRPQPHVFVRSASPLPSTRGSDQCSFSRSLVMRCAEPLEATGSLAYSCSPSAGEASHIPN